MGVYIDENIDGNNSSNIPFYSQEDRENAKKYGATSPENLVNHVLRNHPDEIYFLLGLVLNEEEVNEEEAKRNIKTSTRQILKELGDKSNKEAVASLVKRKLIIEREGRREDTGQTFKFHELTQKGKECVALIEKESNDNAKKRKSELDKRGSIWPEVDKVTPENVEKYFELFFFLLDEGYHSTEVNHLFCLDCMNKKMNPNDISLMERGLSYGVERSREKGFKEEYNPHEAALQLQRVFADAERATTEMCRCGHVRFKHATPNGHGGCMECEMCEKYTWTLSPEQEQERDRWRALDSLIAQKRYNKPSFYEFISRFENGELEVLAKNPNLPKNAKDIATIIKLMNPDETTLQTINAGWGLYQQFLADKFGGSEKEVIKIVDVSDSPAPPGLETIPVSNKLLEPGQGEEVEVDVTGENGEIQERQVWIKDEKGTLHPTPEVMEKMRKMDEPQSAKKTWMEESRLAKETLQTVKPGKMAEDVILTTGDDYDKFAKQIDDAKAVSEDLGAAELRKLAVMELVLKGMSVNDIAKEVELSPATVYKVTRLLKQQAKEELQNYFTEVVPMQVKMGLERLNKMVSLQMSIAEDTSLSARDRTEAISQAQWIQSEIFSILTQDKSFLQAISNAVNTEATKE